MRIDRKLISPESKRRGEIGLKQMLFSLRELIEMSDERKAQELISIFVCKNDIALKCF